jgi:hypothetical protein
MSPGGLLSAGTGAWEDVWAAGLVDPATLGPVLGFGGALPATWPRALQPAVIAAMPATARAPIHRNPRLLADVLVEMAMRTV